MSASTSIALTFAPSRIPTTKKSRTFNCLVTGQVRSGAAIVQTSISGHAQAYCHGDLLHAREKTRRREHELYFGPSVDPEGLPEWCARNQPEGRSNPERYLTTSVYDNPKHHESVLGVKVLYPDLEANDLWDYFRARTLEGDFCVIHVVRNPLACFVSLRQAEQTRIWSHETCQPEPAYFPRTVSVDIDEFVAFARRHEANVRKVRAMADEDHYEITYRDLFFHYKKVMQHVIGYLELPAVPAIRPGILRLRNRSLPERIANFDGLRAKVPSDMRGYFEGANLY